MLHNSYKGAKIGKDLDQKMHLIEIIFLLDQRRI